MKTIYFDMDGTIADLYGVIGWLEQLRAFNPNPYYRASPMLNFKVLARKLNKLQKQGYKLGIITWLSLESNPNYSELVTNRKRRWLKKHLPSVSWDELHFVQYGTPKHLVAKDRLGILFDDNEEVRKKWKGQAYNEKNILQILGGL